MTQSRPTATLIGFVALATAVASACQKSAETDQFCGRPFEPRGDLLTSARADVRLTLFHEDQNYAAFTDRNRLPIIHAFTKPAHPAYPAAICRELIHEPDGSWSVKINIRCAADKAICDQLAADYRQLDREMRESLERDRPAAKRAISGPTR
jgi:hypothetical protein